MRQDVSMGGPGTEQPQRPLLRVVRGAPSPAELAALVAVIASRSGGDVEPDLAPASGWRALPLHGAGAWRLSGVPKGVRTRAAW